MIHFDLVHVYVEPMKCPLSAGEETGDGTARALGENLSLRRQGLVGSKEQHRGKGVERTQSGTVGGRIPVSWRGGGWCRVSGTNGDHGCDGPQLIIAEE